MLPVKQRSILLAKEIVMESHRNVNYVSRLFQPQNFVPKDSQLKKEDSLSKSQKVALFALLQLCWILLEHSEINHLKNNWNSKVQDCGHSCSAFIALSA
jgi:hypothetical protein